MNLTSILAEHTPALIIGNGINRYQAAKDNNSWEGILLVLSHHFAQSRLGPIPKGVTLTEYYDVLDLLVSGERSTADLQRAFCEKLTAWSPEEHHRRIVGWAKAAQTQILTTNFDTLLSDVAKCKPFWLGKRRSTYYPWEAYYSMNEIPEPTIGFSIWHVNGFRHYPLSIRLGLTHYMGCVQRARRWLHGNRDDVQFSGKNKKGWQGGNSWLHIVFNKPLFFMGLGLEENEVFLRWLLIERARYFRDYSSRRKGAWYAHVNDQDDSGKLFFLRSVGVEPIKLNSYDDLYGADMWPAPNGG